MTRKMANRSAAVALLALSALTSVALAEPVKLTDAQMDQVSAGAWSYDSFGNLTDYKGQVFFPGITPGFYLGPDGNFWAPASLSAGGFITSPDGIYYAPAGLYFQPGPVAYGFLINTTTGAISDGGIGTF